MSSRVPLAGVLDAAVRVGDVRVGRVTGVLLDATTSEVLGLEVEGGDAVRRFLPWVATVVADGVVRVSSALLLVEWSDTYDRDGAFVARDRAGLEGLSAPADDDADLRGGGGTTAGGLTRSAYAQHV
jgi:hypothetical protein